ncbi:hypothetical protein ABZ802_31595 [Streptomyces sp. NPDC047737]|uniref:hypothetical protein n=1 Tax=Streptomyces sp. NPDC047737 TaxID=3155740 RepID=UPI0033FDE005
MTETALDPERRYLVPVARLDLPGQPDDVHLSLYEWLPRFEEWATGMALCGYSTTQGALPEGTEATCRSCEAYRPQYQAVLDAEVRAAAERVARKREAAHAADTPENGAWFTVWLEGNWSWVTKKMTTVQREYAADRVAAYSRYLAECDNELDLGEPEGLRWWREAG